MNKIRIATFSLFFLSLILLGIIIWFVAVPIINKSLVKNGATWATSDAASFKTYTNKEHLFSLQIPENLEVVTQYDSDEWSDYLFINADDLERIKEEDPSFELNPLLSALSNYSNGFILTRTVSPWNETADEESIRSYLARSAGGPHGSVEVALVDFSSVFGGNGKIYLYSTELKINPPLHDIGALWISGGVLYELKNLSRYNLPSKEKVRTIAESFKAFASTVEPTHDSDTRVFSNISEKTGLIYRYYDFPEQNVIITETTTGKVLGIFDFSAHQSDYAPYDPGACSPDVDKPFPFEDATQVWFKVGCIGGAIPALITFNLATHVFSWIDLKKLDVWDSRMIADPDRRLIAFSDFRNQQSLHPDGDIGAVHLFVYSLDADKSSVIATTQGERLEARGWLDDDGVQYLIGDSDTVHHAQIPSK